MKQIDVQQLKEGRVEQAQASLESAGTAIEQHRTRTALWRAQRELAAWKGQRDSDAR